MRGTRSSTFYMLIFICLVIILSKSINVLLEDVNKEAENINYKVTATIEQRHYEKNLLTEKCLIKVKFTFDDVEFNEWIKISTVEYHRLLEKTEVIVKGTYKTKMNKVTSLMILYE